MIGGTNGGGGGYYGGGGGGGVNCGNGSGGGGSGFMGGCSSSATTLSGSDGTSGSGTANPPATNDINYETGIGIGGAPGTSSGGSGLVVITAIFAPTPLPTLQPIPLPTQIPTLQPLQPPTQIPTLNPTHLPTLLPSPKPSPRPTAQPTALTLSKSFTINSAVLYNESTWQLVNLNSLNETLYLDVSISDCTLSGQGQYISIQIQGSNSSTLQCISSDTCGASSYCVSDYNLNPYISNSQGGSLNITFGAVCTSNQCGTATCGNTVVYQLNMQLYSRLVGTTTSVFDTYCSFVDSNKFVYLNIVFTVGCGFLGVMVYMVRKQSQMKLLHFSPFLMSIELSILGLDAISDIIYISSLYASYGLISPATVLLVCRIVHPGVTGYLLNIIIGSGQANVYYTKLIDNENLAQNAKLYGVLFVTSVIETTSIKVFYHYSLIIIVTNDYHYKFLPWLETDFSSFDIQK